jgi:hypothetical protein
MQMSLRTKRGNPPQASRAHARDIHEITTDAARARGRDCFVTLFLAMTTHQGFPSNIFPASRALSAGAGF